MIDARNSRSFKFTFNKDRDETKTVKTEPTNSWSFDGENFNISEKIGLENTERKINIFINLIKLLKITEVNYFENYFFYT